MNDSKPPMSDEPEKASDPFPEPPEANFVRPERRDEPTKMEQDLQGSGLAFTLGYSLVFPPIICVLIGLFIDTKFNKMPLWTVIFLFLGIAAGFMQMMRVLQRMDAIDKENRERKKRGQ